MTINSKAAFACAAMLAIMASVPDAQAQQSGWWKKFSDRTPQAAAAPQTDTGTPPSTSVPPTTTTAHQPAATFTAPPAAAEGPAYNYIEAGYNRVEVDSGDVDARAGGGYSRGSVAVSDQVHLFGSYGRVSRDANLDFGRIDVDIDQMELGIGFHYRFAERADFVTDLALLRLGAAVDYRDVDPAYDFSGDDHLYAGKLSLGVRAKPSPRTELWLKGGYVKLEDNWLLDDSFVGVVGGKIDFTRTWGLVGEAELYEDVSYYRIGVRAGF